MNKILLAACLLALARPVLAQTDTQEPKDKSFRIGMKVGLDESKITTTAAGASSTSSSFLGVSGGIPMDIRLGRHFYFSPELDGENDGGSYTAQGYTIQDRLLYLAVPLLAKVRFGTDRLNLGVFAGPQLGYLLSGNESYSNNKPSVDIKGDFTSTNISGVAGIQVAVYNVGLDFRYAIGLSNVASNTGASSGEGTSAKVNVFTMTLYWIY